MKGYIRDVFRRREERSNGAQTAQVEEAVRPERLDIRPRVTIGRARDAESFAAGVRDGAAGKACAPRAGQHACSYLSGHVEGRAFLSGYAVSRDVRAVAVLEVRA